MQKSTDKLTHSGPLTTVARINDEWCPMQRFGVDDRGASDAEQNYRTAQVPGEGQNHKKLEDLDPDPWLSPGHPPRDDELMQIPPSAYRSDKLRVRAFLG
jgi:hypothetical protein